MSLQARICLVFHRLFFRRRVQEACYEREGIWQGQTVYMLFWNQTSADTACGNASTQTALLSRRKKDVPLGILLGFIVVRLCIRDHLLYLGKGSCRVLGSFLLLLKLCFGLQGTALSMASSDSLLLGTAILGAK